MMIDCKCGGRPKYVSSWGMDDQFVCDSCDYATRNYHDGEEYAKEEWKRRNDDSYDPESKIMKTMREILERQQKVNVLRPSKDKREPSKGK